MAKSKTEMRQALRSSFTAFAIKQRRASLVLGARLSVLKTDAALSKMEPGEFDTIARQEMETTMRRMEADVATSHPVAPFLDEVS
ncbi:hypothetical protein [Parasedimentitalea marina]|nr:hypothetical protein [Parasedimentitalea marina]